MFYLILLSLQSFSLINAQASSTCSTPESLVCLGKLQALQSPEQCGPVKLVDDPQMGHKMPSQNNWTMCACDKISQIVECLDKSTCATDKKVAEDFSGIVMHCSEDMGGSRTNTSTSSVSPTARANPNSGVKLSVGILFLLLSF